MKITKSRLKEIIREELEQVSEYGDRRYFSAKINSLVDQLMSSTKSTNVGKWAAQASKQLKLDKNKLTKLFKGYWALDPSIRYNMQTIDLKWWLSKFGIAESSMTEARFTDGKTPEELADMAKSGAENIIKHATQLKNIASKGEKGNWNKADQLVGTIRAIANVQLMLSVDKIKRPGAWKD